MYGFVTYWTFPPRMIGQRQIMKNTWPDLAGEILPQVRPAYASRYAITVWMVR